MSPNNVHPFPAGIPIIGQPFTLKSWVPIVNLVCNCEAHDVVLLVGEAPGACPSCGRGFVIISVAHKLQQPPQIGIGIVRTTPAAAIAEQVPS